MTISWTGDKFGAEAATAPKKGTEPTSVLPSAAGLVPTPAEAARPAASPLADPLLVVRAWPRLRGVW